MISADYIVANLGCWKDNSPSAIEELEQKDDALMDDYKKRTTAYKKCFSVAKKLGEAES